MMLRSRLKKLNFFLIAYGIWALLCLSSSAHVAEQFYSSYDEDRGVLEVNFDIGYAIPESRDDPNTPQPQREWLLARSPAEHQKLRKETINYLLKYISFSTNGQLVDYQISFPDFDASPPSFPRLLNECAYYTVVLTPDHQQGEELTVSMINTEAPKLIVARSRAGETDFHVLEDEQSSLLLISALTSESSTAATSLSAWQRYQALLGIGFKHVIPEGGDHILFIIGICLLAHGFKDLLAQSLIFTFAHSISMAFVISDWFPVYKFGISSWIEPIIALSICFLAVEALMQRQNGKFRYILIASFGLIHGLGFAGSMGSSLQAITPDDSHWMIALLWANLGIELAQATLIIIVFGFLYAMSKSKLKRISNAVPTLKLLIAITIGITGMVWFFQRI